MKLQLPKFVQKELVAPDPEVDDKDPCEEYIPPQDDSVKKAMTLTCTISMFLYAIAGAVLLGTTLEEGPVERKKAANMMLLLNLYAFFFLIASMIFPFYSEHNSRCMKYTGGVITVFATLSHLIGLILFAFFVVYRDTEILTGIFLHMTAFLFEGYYFRIGMGNIFCTCFDNMGYFPMPGLP